MSLIQTIPALPVNDAPAAVDFYRDRLGFGVLTTTGALRSSAATRPSSTSGRPATSWRDRSVGERPVQSGAESFIAGTAGCRIQVEGVDELYAELGARTCSTLFRGRVDETDFGTREFATLDRDGNLVTFFEWTSA